MRGGGREDIFGNKLTDVWRKKMIAGNFQRLQWYKTVYIEAEISVRTRKEWGRLHMYVQAAKI
jgi:hypothetical protein